MHSTYQSILVDIQDQVATIILNRPEVYNAINGTMAKELKHAIDFLAGDPNVKVIVLTGNGKAFCSGQDLNEFANSNDIRIVEVLESRYNPLIMSMQNCPKVIIGKVNGVAAGAGLSLALACDCILAIDSALFSMAFVNIGLVPDCGASYFLPRLVGRAKAFEMCTLGDKFSANDAQKMGLINWVAADSKELDEKLETLTQKYANGPSQAIGMIKQLLNKSIGKSLDNMLEKEASFQEKAGKTADFQEAVQAFREKRKPAFKGK